MYCAQFALPLDKIGGTSTIKIKAFLFCIVLSLHYLCSAMRKVSNIGLQILLLWLVVTLVGCDHEARVLLERAEAFLPAEPDSAEMCLNGIEEPAKLGDESRALYGLLRTYVENRQGKEVKSDLLIRDSYEYYREASDAGQTIDRTLMRHYAQSCYYMALYYYACDSTKQCEDMLHQAIKYSEKCEDWHTCYLAYTQLGNVSIWSNSEYAIQQSLKALDIYYKINDDVNNEVLMLGEIAGSFLADAQPDSALKYYMTGYVLAEQNHLVKSQNNMCMGLACTYRYMGEYEKALNYAKKGITTADSTVFTTSLLTLSQCYYFCDSLKKAKEVLGMISCDSDYITKYLVLRDLSDIAFRQHDYDFLYIYADSAYECMEDRFLQALSVKDEYYQDNLIKKVEKEQIQHEAERNKWVLGFIIVCLVSLSLYIYNVLRNRVVVERHKRLNHILSQRFDHSKHLQEQKEKERIIAEHQKEIQHKQELLHQKSTTLAAIQKHLLEKLEQVRQLLTDNEKTRMTQEAWKDIEHLIDDTDNNFVKNLRKQHEEFDEEDIQLCMLIHLKVTNATIANIFHIGESAVKKRKATLKKTGFQITDSDISLEQVIENL